MHNVYQPIKAKVTKVVKENFNTTTLFLVLEKQKQFQFIAGQFMQIGLPGFGECPISISSRPLEARQHFSLTIRDVGNLTGRLNTCKRSDSVYVRGPFGNGFPAVKQNLILIGGGCGFIPLVSVYQEYQSRPDIRIQLFVGCRDENSLVFNDKTAQMKDRHDFNLIMEKSGERQGFVTDLIKEKELLPGALVFICGPQVMYANVIKQLLAKNVSPENIYLSLEKRMHCGVGVCQHCAIGDKYVCKDGPVFNYQFLKKVGYVE